MRKIVLSLLSVAFLATSCDFVTGERVKGNGNIKEESRTPGSFTGVKSYGFFDVYLSVGNTNSVKIVGEENLLPLIETYIDGNVLKITTKDGYNINSTRDMKVYITAPSWSVIQSNGSGNLIGETTITGEGKLDISVNGSGDVKMEVNAPSVEAGVMGSGNMSLKGETKSLETNILGSGDMRAMDLKAEEVKAKITGSGSAEVYASTKLNVDIIGSGDVRYKGDAQISTNSIGSGSVRKIN